LLAVSDKDEVVGKVTLDLAYLPYAEIVNLMVHPNYRGIGISTFLLRECIKVAEERNFVMQYLMTDLGNKIAHRLYSKHGFIPTILPRKGLPGKSMWLHRFSKESFIKEFQNSYYLLEYSVSKDKVSIKNEKLYRVKWADPITWDRLILYFKGQPGQPSKSSGTMPRISGVQVRKNEIRLEILVKEKSKNISQEDYSIFVLEVTNTGKRGFLVNKKLSLFQEFL